MHIAARRQMHLHLHMPLEHVCNFMPTHCSIRPLEVWKRKRRGRIGNGYTARLHLPTRVLSYSNRCDCYQTSPENRSKINLSVAAFQALKHKRGQVQKGI
eukprot:1159412-Pelagomonas_calceolata.AAC.8